MGMDTLYVGIAVEYFVNVCSYHEYGQTDDIVVTMGSIPTKGINT